MAQLLSVLLFFSSLLTWGQPKISAATFQNNLNKEFAEATSSPLTEDDRNAFKGLDFFPIDSAYIVEAIFKRAENEKTFEMKTTTERAPLYLKYGTISFLLKGEYFQLNVYQNVELSKRKGFKKLLFLPFSDLTSGNETYIGGRYIDVEIPKGETMIVDFNQAYNPYCAYNYKYSCPLVPLENDLITTINAGVKKFHD